MGVVISTQVDPDGAQFGQHYELFNERVIAVLSSMPVRVPWLRRVATGEALAAAGIRRDHDISIARFHSVNHSPEPALRHDVL